MKTLLLLLLAFLRPAVEGDPDPEPDLDLGSGDPDPEPAGDPDPEPAGDPDPEPDPKIALEAERRALATERERGDRFERELREIRDRQPRQEDPQHAEEERILRDPQATDLQKWQVQANRELRAGRMTAQSALAQAQDINDRTSFQSFAVKNPALFKRYETRVEEEYQKMRSKGQSAPREAILRFLIGADAVDGKLQSKKAPASPGVSRGRLPGARSDSQGKNAQTEREKRRARLDNVQI